MASGLRQSKNRSQQEDDFSVLQQTNPMSSQGSSNLASGSLYVPPERTQVHSDDDELSSSNRGPLSFGLGFLKGLGSSDKKSGGEALFQILFLGFVIDTLCSVKQDSHQRNEGPSQIANPPSLVGKNSIDKRKGKI